jgi:hypothetical protein
VSAPENLAAPDADSESRETCDEVCGEVEQPASCESCDSCDSCVQLAAWQALCHALLASNEFVYLR